MSDGRRVHGLALRASNGCWRQNKLLVTFCLTRLDLALTHIERAKQATNDGACERNYETALTTWSNVKAVLRGLTPDQCDAKRIAEVLVEVERGLDEVERLSRTASRPDTSHQPLSPCLTSTAYR